MPRIIFTVSEEMNADLKSIADKRGASVAGVIRLYLANALTTETGKPLEAYIVERGGYRERDDKDEKDS